MLPLSDTSPPFSHPQLRMLLFFLGHGAPLLTKDTPAVASRCARTKLGEFPHDALSRLNVEDDPSTEPHSSSFV